MNKPANKVLNNTKWLDRIVQNLNNSFLIIKIKEIFKLNNSDDKFSLQDIFGITNKISNIYVPRDYVDNNFIKALERKKHIVVYGCSKQGKTSLRKKHLDDSTSIVIQCTNTTTRLKIYEIILKEAGVELSRSQTETYSKGNKFDTSLSSEGNTFFAKIRGEGQSSISRNKSKSTTKNYFEIDPSDVNDVIRILLGTNFKKWIILEDFHYLTKEVQQNLSADLKAIYEKTDLIRIIVIGVWLETGKLSKLNGDLDGRVSYINADIWHEKELYDIIREGEKLLNIFFSTIVKDKIVFYCENNVGLLHQITEKICDKVGITKTQSNYLLILDDSEIRSLSQLKSSFKKSEESNEDIILLESFGADYQNNYKFNFHGGPIDLWLEELSRERSSRYTKFLREFTNGPEGYSGKIYNYLIYVLITAPHEYLRNGLTMEYIYKKVKEKFDDEISRNDFRNAMHKIRELHHELKILPPILDFDTTEDILRVVDSGLLLYHSTHSVQQMLMILGLSSRM